MNIISTVKTPWSYLWKLKWNKRDLRLIRRCNQLLFFPFSNRAVGTNYYRCVLSRSANVCFMGGITTISTWLIGRGDGRSAPSDIPCVVTVSNDPMGYITTYTLSPITKQRWVVMSTSHIYTGCCQMIMPQREVIWAHSRIGIGSFAAMK